MRNLLFKSVDMAVLDRKSVDGLVSIDDEGIVECFVAAIGNKDSVGDIILPGAFNSSLRRRKPRVVWGHDWNHPIGKVLEIYEVGPNDPRLPLKMKAAGVGGLYAKVQFNLNSEQGREAFSNIKFFGNEHEWCVDDKTEILTDRGWLNYDEILPDDRAYVLDPELGYARFEKIESVNVWESKERSLRHIEVGGFSSLSTAQHRWPTVSNHNGGNVIWTTTEHLDYRDRILRAAPRFDAPVLQKYDDSFVELVSWFWCEGWVNKRELPDPAIYIGQSQKVNPQHVASIRAALQDSFPGGWSEKHSKDEIATFRVRKDLASSILGVVGNSKEPTPEFLLNLTRAQLRLLIDTCISADGCSKDGGQTVWYQVSQDGINAFEMACALSGQPTNSGDTKDYGNRFGRPPKRVSLLRSGVAKPLDAIRVKQYGYKKGKPRTVAIDEWVTTTGIVWCPSTPSGTWLARRNGSVYFTGNSIGYKTLDNEFDKQRQANLLKEVELYELSPVLHGANQLTATISIKSDYPSDEISDAEVKRGLAMLKTFADENTEMVKAIGELDEKVVGGVNAGPGDIQAIQDAIGGDALHGRGPHRGNESALLRYWRPIMEKPGGFRRCLVILADHPELGPLPNLCAWLHHETTGKWPNEGNHHGQVGQAVTEAIHAVKKSLESTYGDDVEVVECSEMGVTFKVSEDSDTFTSSYREIDGEIYLGIKTVFVPETPVETLNEKQDDFFLEEKVGRIVSSVNMDKLQRALLLLQEILQANGSVEVKDRVIVVGSGAEMKSAFSIVNSFHDAEFSSIGDVLSIKVKSEQHLAALEKVAESFSDVIDNFSITGESE